MIKPEHLRMARAGLGLTLRELAQEAGVNHNTISRFEAGREVLTGTLERVERTLIELGVVFIEGDQTNLGGVMIRRTSMAPAAEAESQSAYRRRPRS